MRHLTAALLLAIALSFSTSSAADDKDWATLKGQIVFGDDKLPEAMPLKVDKDEKHCLMNGKLLSEDWVIDKESKGIRWAFVYLLPEPGSGKKLPIHPALKDVKEGEVVVDQPCCAFVPHVVALRQGQKLVVKNSAPVAHNIRWAAQPGVNESGNVIVAAGGSHTIEGLRAQRAPMPMSCDIHPWMRGQVRIFDHPYYAVTDAKGNFEIKDAPAGEWRLVVWHDKAGFQKGDGKDPGEKITIKGGAAQDVGKIALKAPAP